MTSRPILPSLENLKPVKPLPGDARLIAFTAAFFAAFSILGAALFGFNGFARMTIVQATVYCGAVALVAMLLATAAVQVAIPGAKVRVPRYASIIGAVLGVALVAIALFPDFNLNHFVHQGIPCLRLACVCALLFGLLAGIPLRRAYITDMRPALLVIGSLAGFSGVAVLTLHCPLQNAAHILVWHLGAVAISAFAAIGVAALADRKRDMMS